jgi:alpha-glucosidase
MLQIKMVIKPVTALIFVLTALACFGQAPAPKSDQPWWKHAVFYEIYPRSFADSNSDGIGDLNGVASRLDYLQALGIDAVWLTPVYPSPQVDFGYDVSDYENIDPVYGTLADFDRLQQEAKRRGIRIIMDFVLNHTSDQHKWFVDSRSSRSSAHRDWYIWRDGRAPSQPPNNWESIFFGSAWTFDRKTGQYYYHYFYPQQPDLNWRNPDVKNAMFDVTRWWYERGVAGFRLDAVSNLFEDPALHDNPVLPGLNKVGNGNMENRYNDNLPEVHDILRGLRKVADEHDAVLIGETWAETASELKKYYGEHNDELQMPMDLQFTKLTSFSAAEFRQHIAGVESAAPWPVFVISNHDIVRSYVRYSDGHDRDAVAKLVAGLYLTLRGTPIMYYGEEIGMENNDPKRQQDVKDPVGKVGWPKEIGRDGERTPMQWNDSTNAGFSNGTPWLPIAHNYKTHNVATELEQPDSILQFYKHLLAFRRQSPALLDGDYIPLNQNDPNVLAYLRRSNDQTILVALNISASPHSVSFDLASQGLSGATFKTLLTTGKTPLATPGPQQLSLEPFAVYIAEVEK